MACSAGERSQLNGRQPHGGNWTGPCGLGGREFPFRRPVSFNVPGRESERRECVVATNPFEDPDARYLVLINDEGQHSLWPVFVDVPDGWKAIFGEDGRQECLDFIEKNWTDMRPNSLIREMEADAAARQGN
jgi:MbtH protein